MATPVELFNSKLPGVLRVVQFRAARGRLPHHDCEDVAQLAALKLWATCQRKNLPSQINAAVVASSAWGVFNRQRGRERVWEPPGQPRD